MHKKELIVCGTIFLIFLSSCAVSYTYRQAQEGGYVVQRGQELFPEFTINEARQYPKDLVLAKERFKRRRGFVENWYKEYEPDALTNSGIAMLKAFLYLPTAPFVAIATIFFPSREPTEQELDESRRRHSEAKREIEDYIVQDCKKENN